MRRILEQKWITYLEVYGDHWTHRQQDTAKALFYAGATAFLQSLVMEVEAEDGPPTEAELDRMAALRMELEEFAARNQARS